MVLKPRRGRNGKCGKNPVLAVSEHLIHYSYLVQYSSTRYQVGATTNSKKVNSYQVHRYWKFHVRAAARYSLLGSHQAVAYRKIDTRPLVYGNDLVRNKQDGTRRKLSTNQAMVRRATRRRGSHQNQAASRFTWCLQRPSPQLAPSPRLAQLRSGSLRLERRRRGSLLRRGSLSFAQAHYVWNAEEGAHSFAAARSASLRLTTSGTQKKGEEGNS